MNEDHFQLRNAPIVEAIIDIDCDMPSASDLEQLIPLAEQAFAGVYPKKTIQQAVSLQLDVRTAATSSAETTPQIHAWRFSDSESKTVVQVRVNGFTFNRLAPYSSLDEYLPEMMERWSQFVEIAAPPVARVLRLRYLNVIRLPESGNEIDLDDYVKIGPRLPFKDGGLIVNAFTVQQHLVESSTGDEARLILTNYSPPLPTLEGQRGFALLFDIQVSSQLECEPNDHERIVSRIRSLRNLKNRIFKESLTDKCIQLFR